MSMSLINAIRNAKVGEIDEIKKLIENKCDVDYLDDDIDDNINVYAVPLNIASIQGRLDIVKILYKAGAKYQYDDIWSTLGFASYYGYVNIVKYLIKKYVISEEDIQCSIYLAIERSNIDVLDYFLTLGYNLNYLEFNPLSWGCLYKNIDIIDRLLNAGANVNVHRFEPLIYKMAEYNRLDIIKRLVMFGGNINASDKSHTPIIIACMRNYTEIAEFLIEMGCDVNCPNIILQTPLMYACRNNNLEIVKLLIKYKADINFLDEYGKKAIDYVNDANNEIKVYLTKN